MLLFVVVCCCLLLWSLLCLWLLVCVVVHWSLLLFSVACFVCELSVRLCSRCDLLLFVGVGEVCVLLLV